MHLFCRNRVLDVVTWKTIFVEHLQAQEKAGLFLENLWISDDSPDTVFFLFRVEDKRRAMEFMADPEAAKAGSQAGVLDGEYYFLLEAASNGRVTGSSRVSSSTRGL